ncbi:MAG: J domain-containing protein [Alphaproteobacteria bacterium]
MRDPYEILGVSPTASDAELKSAYRKLAKELHPDVNPGDTIVEQRFKEVSSAYRMLSDRETRANYDRGEINADGSPRMSSMFRGGARAGSAPDLDDLVANMFGRRRQRQPVKGQGATYSITVPFLEAALGGTRRIRLHDGKHLEVNIPAATKDGDSLRLKGQGMPSPNGGPNGDAFVELQVSRHPFFVRDGLDIRVDVPITLAEAVLGAKIKIPTIHGPVSVTIPPGTNTGKALRLKGKGIVIEKGGDRECGSEYVQLKVVLPDEPDSRLQDFAREWARTGDYDVRRKAGLE